MATKLNISAPVEKLMSVMAKLEALDSEVAPSHHLEPEPRCPLDFSGATELTPKQLLMAAMSRPPVEPPHEPAGSVVLSDIYAGCAFYDDISGAPLDHALATASCKTEIEFKARGDYTEVLQEPCMKVISTKLLDQSNGDSAAPNYRSRLVGCEFAREKRDDMFAATPLLESLRAILAICASRQGGRHPHMIVVLDVARAYFYAPASRPVFIKIPAEDRLASDAGKVAQLNFSFYWTREAAK